jgi:hypothetical protein
MEATLQSIFTHSFPAYREKHSVPLHKQKAAQAIIDCRTAVRGGHVQYCPQGHVERIGYNSCKHRACPKCSALPTERWLEGQKARLLACDHYHVIFTLPHQLNALWWCNNRRMANLLFRCATETLLELLGDGTYLGALPGIIASLHTWGRNLSQHPHLHCLVTGGGWIGESWQAIPGSYLLPFEVVRKRFRGKYVDALRKAHQGGELQLPEGLSEQGLENLLNKLGRKVKGNVHIKQRYAHGSGVMSYLARYVKGGPIGNRHIVKASSGTVSFAYTDHRDHGPKARGLTPEPFIQRILWHIPESGQHTVRYYGLYGHAKKAQRAQCREPLGQPPEESPEFLDWQSYWERLGQAKANRCPPCGHPLVSGAPLPRQQSPPVRIIQHKAGLWTGLC